MNFRTQVELPENETEICHSERLMLLGSCFTENIGNLLSENKFRCEVNPFGILYNPMSIAEALKEVMAKKQYAKADLFFAGGLWHSWMHHGAFSSADVQECIQLINERLTKASEWLDTCDWLMVTWGTAYIYVHKDSGAIVGNCHKQPDQLFIRRKLSVEEIIGEWESLLNKLRQRNPNLKVLFTVSPIRHVKDGMHGNQLSKSTLLLAVHELIERCPNCFYFPSYEIVMDELRDYRFYAEDMVHPSPLAIEYIWECFCSAYMKEGTRAIMQEWKVIRKGLEHRPFHPESEAYRKFLSQIVLKINQLKEKLPYFEVQNEIELCETRLKI